MLIVIDVTSHFLYICQCLHYFLMWMLNIGCTSVCLAWFFWAECHMLLAWRIYRVTHDPAGLFYKCWIKNEPLERGSAHRAEWVNTAALELHLRPTVAKSLSWPDEGLADNDLSTLDAFPGSAHPTPHVKVNSSSPTNSHHPPDDFHHVYFFPLYLYFIATLSFLMSWFCLSNLVTFSLTLMRLFAFFVFV